MELSSRVDDVFKLVFDDCMSPYQAWLDNLGLHVDELPHLLGLPMKDCQYYLKHPRMSPHADNVRFFCSQLGIHPAYLQPALREESFNFFYHPSILEVIVEVFNNPSMSADDRELAKNALQVEMKKFVNFFDKYQTRAEYLTKADEFAQGLARKADLTGLGPYLSKDFGAAVDDGLHDIEHNLDLYRDYLGREQESLDQEMVRCSIDLGWVREKIFALGDKIYGEDVSKQALDVLVDRIFKMNGNNMDVPDSFWASFQDDILVGFSLDERDNILDAPPIQPDFEACMKVEGTLPRETKAEFLKILPGYVKAIQMFKTASIALVNFEARLKSFDDWRAKEDTHYLDIPLYKNFCAARSCLSSRIKGIKPGSVLAVHWE